MNVRSFDASSELGSALRLLVSQWTLALPTAIGSLIGGVLVIFTLGTILASLVGAGTAVATGHRAGAFALLGAGALTTGLAFLGVVLIAGATHVMVIAAAEDAWQGRAPDFGAALRKTLVKTPVLVLLFACILLLAAIPVALSFVLIGIPVLIALGFFLMYALPAVVVGSEGAFSAIRASFRLVRANLGASFAAYAAMMAALAIGRGIDATVLHIPILGLIATFIVGGATSAYAALVAVRFYDVLTARPS